MDNYTDKHCLFSVHIVCIYKQLLFFSNRNYKYTFNLLCTDWKKLIHSPAAEITLVVKNLQLMYQIFLAVH